MGAVQKLATVVIVGLVGLATLLVVYLANEPSRRTAEAAMQEHVAIERGIQTYIQNCVVCHGPAGEGSSEPNAKGTGRIGMPLGGSTEAGQKATQTNQTTNPADRQKRYDLIVKTLENGRGLMPAWGSGAEGGALLNDEQIHELALMIQNVDWNEVFNKTIAADGGYPTFPPGPTPRGGSAPAAAQTGGGQGQAPSGGGPPVAAQAQPAAPAGGPVTLTAVDIAWEYQGKRSAPGAPVDFTVAAGTVISLPNEGASQHNFAVDALNISVDMPPGETVQATIPADAKPGKYEYYCNVPGHKEAGMVGTLTIAPAGAAAAGGGQAAPAGGQAASPAGGGQPAPSGQGQAAAPLDVTLEDIKFDPTALSIPANTPVTVNLTNSGASQHDFNVDALNVHSGPIDGGGSKQITINAPAGTYEYYCDVPGHKEAGMVGTLTVQ